MIKPFRLRSNWQMVALYLINQLVRENKRRFTRPQLMKNLDDILPLLKILKHKENQEKPQDSLQNAIQKMRDKKWINFRGGGEYELTDEGYKVLLENKEYLNGIIGLKEDLRKLL